MIENKKTALQEGAIDVEKPDDKLFNRVWDMTKELNENIRHYNEHQAKYRALASQWLLGSLAAIGFLLVSRPDLPFDKLWLVPLISVVTLLGIYQLWRMDMPVFQNLISAFFTTGLEMEVKYRFLPPVKMRILKNVKQHSAGYTLFNFYFMIIMVLTLISVSTIFYLTGLINNWGALITGSVIIIAALIFLYKHMKKRSTNTNEKIVDL